MIINMITVETKAGNKLTSTENETREEETIII